MRFAGTKHLRPLVQLQAGREMVAMGKHQGTAQLGIPLQQTIGVGQLAIHGAVHGVVFLGSVETDEENVAVTVTGDGFHGKRPLLGEYPGLRPEWGKPRGGPILPTAAASWAPNASQARC